MNLLDTIKSFIANRQLKKELINQLRVRKTVSLNDAKTIGVLYSIPDEETYKVIFNFLKSIKTEQKTVIALGYYDDNKLPSYLNQSIYNSIIMQKDLNWYKKPVNQYVNNFFKENFDLFLNISVKEYYPLLYISAMAKAYMKVGRFNEKHTAFYDVMIKVEDNTSQAEFLENTARYLNMLKNSD
ncbi:MAG: hypothetical protein WCO63_14465 [Bacteroidota bacterium]